MGFLAPDTRSTGKVRPADYPPPVQPGEFVTEPSAVPADRVDVGVLVVGGGPAGMACAIRLTQLLRSEPALAETLGEVPVVVVEKARSVGSHLLSGAVMDPSAMRRLFPDLPDRAWPTYGTVEDEAVYLLSRKRALRLPRVPPPFRNRGNRVVSLAQLGRWLSERAEQDGVTILPETVAYELLVKDGVVQGVRTGAKGRGRDGEPLSNFEPGSELHARATVLAEGTQGHLALAAIEHFELGSPDPQGWELGVKEVWEIKRPLQRVIHTMGWPLRAAAGYREFGGSFVYPMGKQRVSLGPLWVSTTVTPPSRCTTCCRS